MKSGKRLHRLGAQLRALRREKGLTMRNAAVRAGVSRQSIVRAEKGDVSLVVLARLLRAYRAKDKQRLIAAYLRSYKELSFLSA